MRMCLWMTFWNRRTTLEYFLLLSFASFFLLSEIDIVFLLKLALFFLLGSLECSFHTKRKSNRGCFKFSLVHVLLKRIHSWGFGLVVESLQSLLWCFCFSEAVDIKRRRRWNHMSLFVLCFLKFIWILNFLDKHNLLAVTCMSDNRRRRRRWNLASIQS